MKNYSPHLEMSIIELKIYFPVNTHKVGRHSDNEIDWLIPPNSITCLLMHHMDPEDTLLFFYHSKL